MQTGSSLLRIRALRDTLKSAERRLADSILADPEAALGFTIRDLQQKSNTSYATVIRFCKKAGYAGFKEFKTALMRDVLDGESSMREAGGIVIERGDTVATICGKVLDSAIRTLDETRGIVDTQALERAAEAIVNARETVIIGTGTSAISARYAFSRLFRLGLSCSAIDDATIFKQKAAVLGARDVLFTISASGRSISIVGAAKIARGNGARVIGMGDFAVSPLSRTADINLYTTPRNAAQFMDIEMPLIISQITLIDILFACCIVKLGPVSLESFGRTKDTADREKIGARS